MFNRAESQEVPLTLTGLLEHYSPSGDEKKAVEWLVRRMVSLGYSSAYSDEAGNAIGVMGHGPRVAVLLGHIDTVPGEIAVRQEGDRLYGRGTVDAKGPLAAFVDAVARLGAVEGWQFIVAGAVDEERDSSGARYLAGQLFPEFAIVGEPGRWERLTLGYKGSAWARVTTRRAVGHSAGPQESACQAAFHLWQSVQEWADLFNAGAKRTFDQLSVGLYGLDSGGDGFEEWAGLKIGARLPPGFLPEDWYAALRQLAAGADVEAQGFAVPAYKAPKNNGLVKVFLSSIRAADGKPGFVLKSGTSDLNVVAPVWKCPVVVYGPGDSSLDHTPVEHISLIEYQASVSVLMRVLERLVSE